MGETNGGVGNVDVLAAGAAGPIRVHAQVFLVHLDIHVFGDLGQVWGDNRSRTDPQVLANDKFDSKNWRTGFGGGFQYRYSKDLGLRIEAGRSNERTLIYFSIGRGF